MANIKDFIKKIGNSAVSLEEQQQALAQVEQTIIEAKQKRTEAVGKNADMVIQALKTIEAKLEDKLAELNNTPAKQGVQGPTGKAGKDGKNGQDGRDGVSGKDGTDGKDGVDGKDGISVTDAKIDFDGSLVVYLSNGNEIDCGQILSPDVAQNIIINSGGSGTSQTVTDTLVSLQNQINTLTGIDGVLGDMAQQNANAVAITGGTITGVSGLGTVTSVAATVPSVLSITGSPITTSGTLAIGYSGTALPVANGGTGATTASEAITNLRGWETTATAAGTTTLTNASATQQNFTGSTTQTVVLPVTSTLALGWAFEIINNSTGNLTVNSSGGNLIGTVVSGTTVSIVCNLTSGTTAASWDFDIDGFATETGSGSVVRSTSPTLSGITITGTLALTGTSSGTAQFATNQSTANTTICSSQTSGSLTIGGTNGTGQQVFGRSTQTQETSISIGATVSGSTKTINIGTAGVSGSTTAINIGSAVSGATSTTTLNGLIVNSISAAVSATGTTQAGATGLVSNINNVTVVTAAAAGVRLPTAVAGMRILIRNSDSADTLSIYPATGGTINALAANAAFTLAAGSTIELMATTATQWYTF
jgi:hypothetical protein